MLESGQVSSENWHKQLSEFMEAGNSKNSTFRLHMEMMQYCDEIVAVYLAERLGGFERYNLLFGAVKSSLLFSFLNGASSYGPFCVRLLLEHFSAGHFHKCMKKTLYSTPITNASTNFTSDSKREMDHQDVLCGLRSGSTLPAVTSRISFIDSFNETHDRRTNDREKSYDSGPNETNQSDVEWKFTEVDLNHIISTPSLILRREGLNVEECLQMATVLKSCFFHLQFWMK
ncbi:unnamed protein product [Mytilus coruscus]|uniref:Uncharacterized protein n=1 Tax=Mytilus coruscus TaxID=42192 RepID=A0A6J8CEQ8_MYTCO|nr:unnamed protein product [Mytilus coruscus]